jgi:hypothetical protein
MIEKENFFFDFGVVPEPCTRFLPFALFPKPSGGKIKSPRYLPNPEFSFG